MSHILICSYFVDDIYLVDETSIRYIMWSTYLNSGGGKNIGLVNIISDMAKISEPTIDSEEGTPDYWSGTRHSAH